MASVDNDRWTRCSWYGWWGYIVRMCRTSFYCMMSGQPLLWKHGRLWIDWREGIRNDFRKCCGKKGFAPDDWFQCTICGWWGYFGEDVPDKYSLKFVPDEENRFELLCKWCF